MVKIYYFISACLLLFTCNNNNNKEGNVNDTINDTIVERLNNRPIPQKTKYNLTKLYYRVLFNEDCRSFEIDTLTYVEIKDSLLIDKISMDWFLLKINKIDTVSGVINIYIGEESDYEDDPILYKFGKIYSNRHIYYIKRKGKYLSITNDAIPDNSDVYIEKEKVKDSGLKYYTYEDQVD